MPAESVMDLVEYTEWQRLRWHQFVENQAQNVLELSPGPHAGDRFRTVGEVIRHIFSAEKRYLERLQDQPLSDFTNVAANDANALFYLGQMSRLELRGYLSRINDILWNEPREFAPLMNHIMVATPRKVIMHVLLHEVRHWAQIATVFRMQGFEFDYHDFLFSPVLGDSRIS